MEHPGVVEPQRIDRQEPPPVDLAVVLLVVNHPQLAVGYGRRSVVGVGDASHSARKFAFSESEGAQIFITAYPLKVFSALISRSTSS